jgi:hypothetical protein
MANERISGLTAVATPAGTDRIPVTQSADINVTSKYETLSQIQTYALTNGTVTGTMTFPNTGVRILDTNATHTLAIAAGSDLTASRTLNIVTADSSRTMTLTGDPTLSDWFDQSVKQAATPTFAGVNATTFTGGAALSGGTIGALTSFGIRATGAAFDLKFANTEVLTGNKTLTFNLADTNRTLTMLGNAALDQDLTTNNTPTFAGMIVSNNYQIIGGNVAGHVWYLGAYDNDLADYKQFATFTAGNTPSCAWAQPANSTLTWNGGAIDNAVIGGSTPAAGTFTSLVATSETVTTLNTTTINTTAGIGVIRSATVNTTDATVTTIATIGVDQGTAKTVYATVTGYQTTATAGSAGGGVTITVSARRSSGGNIVLVTEPFPIGGFTSAATVTADVDTGTQSIRIRVTGVAATNYTWTCNLNYC